MQCQVLMKCFQMFYWLPPSANILLKASIINMTLVQLILITNNELFGEFFIYAVLCVSKRSHLCPHGLRKVTSPDGCN